MGFSPSESCSPAKSRVPFETFLLSCRLPVTDSEEPVPTCGYRALLPSPEPFSLPPLLTPAGDFPLLGFRISEAFPLASLLPLRVNSSSALHNHQQPKPLAYAVP